MTRFARSRVDKARGGYCKQSSRIGGRILLHIPKNWMSHSGWSTYKINSSASTRDVEASDFGPSSGFLNPAEPVVHILIRRVVVFSVKVTRIFPWVFNLVRASWKERFEM
eukprot:10666_4